MGLNKKQLNEIASISEKIMSKTHLSCMKFVLLVRKYPNRTLNELLDKVDLPSVDLDFLVFNMVNSGIIEEPTQENPVVLKPPYNGENIQSYVCKELMKDENVLILSIKIGMVMEFIAKTAEADIVENTMKMWLRGYPSLDQLAALTLLVETNKMAEYEIEDGENKYLFYTLYENKDKLWGRKQFKKDPLKTNKRKKNQK